MYESTFERLQQPGRFTVWFHEMQDEMDSGRWPYPEKAVMGDFTDSITETPSILDHYFFDDEEMIEYDDDWLPEVLDNEFEEASYCEEKLCPLAAQA